MISIRAKSNISTQNSFKNKNWINELKRVEEGHEMILPDYKEFIPANVLRRLSPILKNALTCAIDCFQQSEEAFDSIIVGTGLGCLTDTEKFLITINNASSEKEALSPTAFIQSTHNTIGGQISLFMKNHSYNMTHTQNSLSFEVSLIDGILALNEGKNNVFVGAIDERIEFLKELDDVIDRKNYPLSSGATFFCLSEKNEKTYPVFIKDVQIYSNVEETDGLISEFLTLNKIEKNEIDLVLFSGIHEKKMNSYKNQINYTQYAGFNYSNSAFAMDFGIEWLMDIKNKTSKTVLIINQLCVNNLGLILLNKNEA